MARSQGGNMGAGCIMSILGGVLSLCITGGVIVYVMFMQNQAMSGVSAGTGQQPSFFQQMASGQQAWNGSTTFECGGNDSATLSGQVVNATASPAIRAGGNCQLSLVGMNVTAPVVLEAGGNARVTVTGGVLLGTIKSISASGNSNVTVVGATVTGPTERSGFGTIAGVP